MGEGTEGEAHSETWSEDGKPVNSVAQQRELIAMVDKEYSHSE